MASKKQQPPTGGPKPRSRTPKPPPPPRAEAAVGAAPAAAERGPFPIVGLGASAGGLGAFEAFFSGMPGDVAPGMAFVLVQHLDPDHKSILTELIRRYTKMQVFEVEDGMTVQPDCAYIIPPNCDMAFLNGTLQLFEPTAPRGQRMPIDFFFRSLAQDQRERAIGVVLSGTGSDGTLGVRAIKGEGGMVMAQSPETTEYDGMPRSAIATGLVDFEAAPAKMAARLIAYATHAFGRTDRAADETSPKAESVLKKLFVLLRTHTGHDFSLYKPSTIHRRIERRMSVHQIPSLESYLRFAQQTPAEVEALFRDLLIGVTSFFRDAEAFKLLEEKVIPKLFQGKAPGAAIRIWAPGCSTGEEAYSLAILLQERLESLKLGYTVQVFATDIDSRAIASARSGVYPTSIADDISPERLARFFALEPDGGAYRIHKGIRDLLVFSEQDVIKDPPFSRLDLISCRNLLIYMGVELQKKLIPMFHYALQPGGVLFLGTSETVGEYLDLFGVLDRKAKLYERKQDFPGARRVLIDRYLPPLVPAEGPPYKAPGTRAAAQVKMPLRELTEQALLQQTGLAAALVNRNGDILYLHGRTGAYLEPAPGEAGINNILKMAREGLKRELAKALRRAADTGEVVRVRGLRIRTNGHLTQAVLVISPVLMGSGATREQPLYLVTLEEAAKEAGGAPEPHAVLEASGPSDAETEARIAALRQELRDKEEYLQSSNEELETSNEELKSSNEEMQSVNEELQSTNEELETSKEELQSVNEELATVNAELQTKVADLSRANNDMNNLLAGTGIGTVFVDHQLRIMRFTPSATRIINLISGDVGRPVGHIMSNLVGYQHLAADVRSVLDTLVAKEVEVQATDGRWYIMRIMPYRTLENVIEGAVVTFVEITETVRTRDLLKQTNGLMRLAVVVRDAQDAITVQGLDGRILAWNPGAERLYGWTEAEALAMNVRDRIPEEGRPQALEQLRQLSQAELLEPCRTQRLTRHGAALDVSVTSTALLDEHGQFYAIATTERVIGVRKHRPGPSARVPEG